MKPQHNGEIPPITPRQQQLIVGSFRRVFATSDIEKLTTSAYRFIHLASGFIAHYNIVGFRDYYSNVSQLRAEIIENENANRWLNFRQGEKNYDYYMSKAAVYKEIAALARK